MLPFWARVDLGTMAMNGYSSINGAALSDCLVILRTLVGDGFYLSAEMQSSFTTPGRLGSVV